MLFGEHAVLRGKTAVVAAINARLEITLTPNNINKIIIFSNFSNSINQTHLALDLDNLDQELKINKNHKQLIYVLESIQHVHHKHKITLGFSLDLTIGNLRDSVGFGSSAAVTVGVLSVVHKFATKIQYKSNSNNLDLTKDSLLNQSIKIIHRVQEGIGSGADLAASIYGGIISYKNFVVENIVKKSLSLTTIYCGYKIKTIEVVKTINLTINQSPQYQSLFNHIFNSLDFCSKLAIQAIEKEDFPLIGKLMDVAHGCMSGLGIVDSNLDRLATDLRSMKGIYGSKVSGAGLGDCVIGLGTMVDPLRKIINVNLKEEIFNLTTEQQGILWL